MTATKRMAAKFDARLAEIARVTRLQRNWDALGREIARRHLGVAA